MNHNVGKYMMFVMYLVIQSNENLGIVGDQIRDQLDRRDLSCLGVELSCFRQRVEARSEGCHLATLTVPGHPCFPLAKACECAKITASTGTALRATTSRQRTSDNHQQPRRYRHSLVYASHHLRDSLAR